MGVKTVHHIYDEDNFFSTIEIDVDEDGNAVLKQSDNIVVIWKGAGIDFARIISDIARANSPSIGLFSPRD